MGGLSPQVTCEALRRPSPLDHCGERAGKLDAFFGDPLRREPLVPRPQLR